MSVQQEYRRLTRGELRNFDDQAQAVILQAMEAGATGKISTKGHAILRGPNGMTMSVSRNQSSANRARQNTLRDLNNMFPEGLPEKVEPVKTTQSEVPVVVLDPNASPTFTCPANKCGETFKVYGALYTHIQENHVKCTHPGCDYVARNETGRMAHHRTVHEGYKARVGNGKNQKAAKKLDAIRAIVGGPTEEEMQTLRDELKESRLALAATKKELDATQKQVKDLSARLAKLKEALDL